MGAENTIADPAAEQIKSLDLELQKVGSVPGCAVVAMKGYIEVDTDAV